MQELGSMEALGFSPGPEHYDPVIQAVAASGAVERARAVSKRLWSR